MPTDCSVCYRPVTTNGFARIFTVLRDWRRLPGEYHGERPSRRGRNDRQRGAGGPAARVRRRQGATSVYVQVPGAGLRIKAALLKKELARSASMRTVMLHYADAFFNQVAQSAACNHFHSLEQRCCRWLLMTHDRMQSDEFLLTQEFLAMMLGKS